MLPRAGDSRADDPFTASETVAGLDRLAPARDGLCQPAARSNIGPSHRDSGRDSARRFFRWTSDRSQWTRKSARNLRRLSHLIDDRLRTFSAAIAHGRGRQSGRSVHAPHFLPDAQV